MRELLQQIFAHSGTDFRRFHREALVRTLCLYLEGDGIFQLVAQIFGSGGFDLLKILVYNARAAECSDAEYLL